MKPWSRTRKTTSTWPLTMKANVLSRGPGTAAAAVSYVFKLDCYSAADLRYLRGESMKKSTEKLRENEKFIGNEKEKQINKQRESEKKMKRSQDLNREAKRQ